MLEFFRQRTQMELISSLSASRLTIKISAQSLRLSSYAASQPFEMLGIRLESEHEILVVTAPDCRVCDYEKVLEELPDDIQKATFFCDFRSLPENTWMVIQSQMYKNYEPVFQNSEEPGEWTTDGVIRAISVLEEVCFPCKNPPVESSPYATNHLRGFVIVFRRVGLMDIITNCEDNNF